MRVTVYQDRRQRFSGTAAQVILPGEEGELSVLSFHAPMLCVLGAGDVYVDRVRFPIRSGFARVARNAVTILIASGAHPPEAGG